MPRKSVMNRLPGAWRPDLHVQPRHQRRCVARLLFHGLHERSEHGQEQCHQERGRAALARDVAERHHETAVSQVDHVEEVAAHRVRRPAEADGFRRRSPVQSVRQHGHLDLAGDLQVVLEREPLGDLEQHQQVHQQEAKEQPARAVRHAGTGCEPDHAKERGDQRQRVHHPPRGRHPHRERQEDQACPVEVALVPGKSVEFGEVHVAREEVVGFARIAREQPLQVLGLQVARVGIDELGDPF